MKKMSKKSIVSMLAVILVASALSISAVAATSYPHEDYSLSAGETSGPILYKANATYMYFNTQPISGTGGVNLSVSGPGVYIKGEKFPYFSSRSPLKINTSSGIGNYYTVYLEANDTPVTGTLSVWTSSN